MNNGQAQNIQIHAVAVDKKAAEKTVLMNNALAGAVTANQDLRATAVDIQKRGFTYTGDSHQMFGTNSIGVSTGLNGTGPPYFGRGPAAHGLLLQPFGIGANSLLSNSITPSIFPTSGAGVAYRKTTRIAQMKMAMAVEAYKGFGIVKNVIDLMCNFASEGIKIQHPKPAIRRFYERWAQLVDLQGRIKHILRSYYKHGNVFIYTTMGIVDPEAVRQMRSTRGSAAKVNKRMERLRAELDKINAVGDNNDPSLTQRRNEIKKELRKDLDKRLVPWKYTVLNPFQMERVGSKFFGESKWIFIIDEDTFNDMKNQTVRTTEWVDILDDTDVNLPPEFKKLADENKIVALNQARLCTMHYMKDDHEDWADPMVWPVMNDILYKNQLRSMDMSVINSTINAITIFKLGKIDQGYVSPPEHYKEFAQMLRTPTYSHNIIWNDAIEMESNYPPIEKILGIEKYKSVDKDILAGLGVPGILVDGATGGSFSNAFLQVRTLLEKLEEGRSEVMKWVNKQLRIIATTMGHQQVPTIKFGQMSLRDEQAEKQLIIQLIDRGIISVEDVHEVFGIDTVQTLERIKRENELAEQGILVQHGPYKEPMTDTLEEDFREMDFEHQDQQQDKQLRVQEKIKKQETKVRMQQQIKQQKQNVKPNGRPGGSKGIPQEKKRKTKPVGMGIGQLSEFLSLRTKAAQVYTEVEDNLTKRMLELKGVKYKKSLSKEDRKNLETLVYGVFSNMNLLEDVTNERIEEVLSAPSINCYVDRLVKEFANVEDMSTSERRDVRINALASYHLGAKNV